MVETTLAALDAKARVRGVIEANSRVDEGPVAELAEAVTQLPANVQPGSLGTAWEQWQPTCWPQQQLFVLREKWTISIESEACWHEVPLHGSVRQYLHLPLWLEIDLYCATTFCFLLNKRTFNE